MVRSTALESGAPHLGFVVLREACLYANRTTQKAAQHWLSKALCSSRCSQVRATLRCPKGSPTRTAGWGRIHGEKLGCEA